MFWREALMNWIWEEVEVLGPLWAPNSCCFLLWTLDAQTSWPTQAINNFFTNTNENLRFKFSKFWGWNPTILQELLILSSVTIDCQVTKIVMNTVSQSLGLSLLLSLSWSLSIMVKMINIEEKNWKNCQNCQTFPQFF